MQQIPKAAVRASNNAIKGYIPHNAISFTRGKNSSPVAGAGEVTKGQEGQENGKGLQR